MCRQFFDSVILMCASCESSLVSPPSLLHFWRRELSGTCKKWQFMVLWQHSILKRKIGPSILKDSLSTLPPIE